MSHGEVLSAEHLASLATGYGSEDAIEFLIAERTKKTALQLRSIVEASGLLLSPGRHQQIQHFYDLLAKIQTNSPGIVGWLLMQPSVDAWSSGCIELLKAVRPGRDPNPLYEMLGYLGSIVATAAILAQYPATLAVPVSDGYIQLPKLGRAIIDPNARESSATVEITSDAVRITADGRCYELPADLSTDNASWLAVRRATFGDKIVLDVDFDEEISNPRFFGTPFGGAALAGRMSADDFERWHAAVSKAWRLLETHHAERAKAIAKGVRSLVPMAQPERGSSSATAHDAFGAIALSLSMAPAVLAVALVHEFQHGKLSVILDTSHIYEATNNARFYAPWRDDPRPLGPFLHGIYAHMGIVQFWDTQRTVATGPQKIVAEVEFARWRDQTREAVQELESCEELTDSGHQLVAGIIAGLDGLRTERISAQAQELANWASADHRISWRLRNLAIDADIARSLARAWLSGDEPPTGTVPVVRVTDPPSTSLDRLYLLYDRLTHAAKDGSRGHAADRHYVEGAFTAAASAYREAIRNDPGCREAWAGLALSGARIEDSAGAGLFASRPELVAHVYRAALAIAPKVGPAEDLAAWIADGQPQKPSIQPEARAEVNV